MANEAPSPRIVLLQYGPHRLFGPLPTFDPECLAAQAYMKFTKVPFIENNCNNPNASPLKKLPVLSINEVKTVVHTDIVNALDDMGYDLDHRLSASDKADVEAWKSLIQHRLHHAQLYNWWMEPNNFEEEITLQLTSAGYLDDRAAYDEADKCYKALSQKLGTNKYFFGVEPTSMDAVAFGYLATQLIPELPDRKLHHLLSKYPNLVDFVNGILKTYFSATKPVEVDAGPAKIWLDLYEEERDAKLKAVTQSESPFDFATAVSIAFGIGATVLFLATRNVQFGIWFHHATRYFMNEKKTTATTPALTEEQIQERNKWLGMIPAASLVTPEDLANAHVLEAVQWDNMGENPMKRVNPFSKTGDSEIYMGDDGKAYDWDEGYLDELVTGSDIPEEYEDLGDEDDDSDE